MNVDSVLTAIPAPAVYATVGGVIGLESLGIPLPGEVILVSAALLASHHAADINPVGVGAAAVVGAVVGDSIGYAIGRRFGMHLFDRLERRFPQHFGRTHVAFAEHVFQQWGPWAVFLGRFIAILRILAGPLAGALKMAYPRFLVANVAGGLCWAGGTTALVYYLGVAAERWLSRFSWIGLVVALLCGIAAALFLRHRLAEAIAKFEADTAGDPHHATD
ncbi:MAG: DedA family protein [Mycobacteriaceae bacterium]|nr:DedA family protein [Mycobacteriaceae bacterium]